MEKKNKKTPPYKDFRRERLAQNQHRKEEGTLQQLGNSFSVRRNAHCHLNRQPTGSWKNAFKSNFRPEQLLPIKHQRMSGESDLDSHMNRLVTDPRSQLGIPVAAFSAQNTRKSLLNTTCLLLLFCGRKQIGNGFKWADKQIPTEKWLKVTIVKPSGRRCASSPSGSCFKL